MNDSIFTKIIKGEIPCYKVYEDENTIAFLDINPSQPGHTLVVPKNQVEFVWDLPDSDYQALMVTCKKVAKRLREVLEVKYVGVRIIGEEIPHAHVHLIPFNKAAQYFTGHPSAEPDQESLAVMAKELAF